MKECAADKNWDQFYHWVQRMSVIKVFLLIQYFYKKVTLKQIIFDKEYLTRKFKFRHFCQLQYQKYAQN